MDSYIPISAINDFLFCPYSLYYHSLYTNFNEKVYHQTPQVEGRLNHKTVDTGTYSTSKNCIQGLSVCCEKYRLVGKIDTFFVDRGELVERKTKVKRVYDGYRYQLFSQYFCLQEMGYLVKKLAIHSLSDNKRYPIDFPTREDIVQFEETIEAMRSFDITRMKCNCPPSRHEHNIYKELY